LLAGWLLADPPSDELLVAELPVGAAELSVAEPELTVGELELTVGESGLPPVQPASSAPPTISTIANRRNLIHRQ
jgi:hypothetical protein